MYFDFTNFFLGNEAGFFVDKKTGVIKVGNKLDRESQNRYVLTILAKNLGSIHGNDTDEAQVIIQVQDGNDPPVFKKSRYQAKVSEDSPVGTKVVQTLAVDKDVRPRNSQFVYVIAEGIFRFHEKKNCFFLCAIIMHILISRIFF